MGHHGPNVPPFTGGPASMSLIQALGALLGPFAKYINVSMVNGFKEFLTQCKGEIQPIANGVTAVHKAVEATQASMNSLPSKLQSQEKKIQHLSTTIATLQETMTANNATVANYLSRFETHLDDSIATLKADHASVANHPSEFQKNLDGRFQSLVDTVARLKADPASMAHFRVEIQTQLERNQDGLAEAITATRDSILESMKELLQCGNQPLSGIPMEPVKKKMTPSGRPETRAFLRRKQKEREEGDEGGEKVKGKVGVRKSRASKYSRGT
jgi:chromosome segregation ATPase